MSEFSLRIPPAPMQKMQQGVVLLETLVAVLIFSFAVLGIVGLQASMVKNTSEAKYRADASYIAQQRIGAIWADPANAANYIEANTDISNLLPSGSRSVTLLGTNQYQVTVTWQAPGEAMHSLTTVATIVGG